MRTLVMIMAGGKGSRLAPLTCHRAKPAVPFGGRYRIIDFVLSNFVNSGYRHIHVLTQYMATSLIRHLARNWNLTAFGQFIEAVPAQMRLGERWYEGTADSVRQNINLIRDAHCEHVAVFGGDHIYRFAVDQMEQAHLDRRADLTVAAFPVPLAEASRYGVIQVNKAGRIIGFQEKPANPEPMPNRPSHALVSMGNYFFRRPVLEEALMDKLAGERDGLDFGKHVIPALVEAGATVYIHDFADNAIRGDAQSGLAYWRDVGTIDSYFDANMDLRSAVPEFNLYNRFWPIRSAQRNYPPAKFVRDGAGGRNGELVDSLVCEGTIVCSASLVNVVAGYDCHFHSGALVDEAVILSGCDVGAGTRLRRVMLDKNCAIAAGTVIGWEAEEDRVRFPFITDGGIIVLPKGTFVPREGPIELAQDVAELLSRDPATADIMRDRADTWAVSKRPRFSDQAASAAL